MSATTSSDAGAVIIGAGIAGMTAAETLRANGFEDPITVIAGEPGPPFRRTALSKDLLTADLSDGKVTLRKPEHWQDKGIDIRTGVEVTAIDTDRRVVVADDEIPYAVLILATGAQPRRPASFADDVAVLRTREHAEGLRDALVDRDTRLVVVGGGLIGLELAASAATAGMVVTVLEAADRLAARVGPPQVSECLARLHTDHGVDIRTGVTIAQATADSVHFADGSAVDGLVVAAIGVAPVTDLAERAGIATTPVGIVTDSALRTSVTGVYAAGDCAAVPDPATGRPARSEHWLAAGDQGAQAARTVISDLANGAEPTEALALVPLAWSMQYGVNLQFAGWPGRSGDVEVEGSLGDMDAEVLIRDEGVLIGAVCVARPRAGRTRREEIRAGLPTVVPA
ncbi:NAD(P)/FAD-dependent oxidoreductase [Williamsia sterculiae]|uniref:Reductase C-terminal n=1 Tax=Williamsia sterculiae TaxID=1344003 RepID=A0A1N7GSY1_9NOCA|nr:FAD-dependent oxidoreductase [Williamsia sterculiae]SIS15660.1 Reductase C-terminal [Williamsia sterculiae]